MRTSTMTALAILSVASLAPTVFAQSRFTGHSFDEAGAFHLRVSGAAELESSPDLQSWAKFASVTQETGLDDGAARQMEKRFYRVRGSTGPGAVVGFVKITVPPGKLAILGNSFDAALRLDTPEARHAVFGLTNPAVKVSLYTNASFVASTLDAASGAWNPPLKGVKAREGFAVQNAGTTPLTVRLSGPVRQMDTPVSLPAGASLVVPSVPLAGPFLQVIALPAKSGMQVNWFNEDTQSYLVSSFDELDGKWTPKLPDYRPGRAFVLKTKDPVSWTDKFPAAAH